MTNKNQPLEIWKDIPGYEGLYQVSNFGNVKSLNYRRSKKEGLLKFGVDKNIGYYFVILYKNKIKSNFDAHQLVAMAFLGHIPCGHKKVVDHINYVKTDNRLENLRIITNRKNSDQSHIKSSSKYTGVTRRKNNWESSIVFKRRLIYLGKFLKEEEARDAYLDALNLIEKEIYSPPLPKEHKNYYFNKKTNRYQAKITINKKVIFLGNFEKEEDAKKAVKESSLKSHY